jgi:hypothetical protein
MNILKSKLSRKAKEPINSKSNKSNVPGTFSDNWLVSKTAVIA